MIRVTVRTIIDWIGCKAKKGIRAVVNYSWFIKDSLHGYGIHFWLKLYKDYQVRSYISDHLIKKVDHYFLFDMLYVNYLPFAEVSNSVGKIREQ